MQVALGFSGPDRPIEFRCCGVHSIWGRTSVPSSGGIRGMARPSCCICDVQSNLGMCRSSDLIRHAHLSHRMSVASMVCGTEFRPPVDRRCVAFRILASVGGRQYADVDVGHADKSRGGQWYL
ncbi:uncharacterized protein B0H18DRAFT_614621 [Fomitopsis serialis]|uniref:uncharacterized protein n=1 Tax=Fomitopsis serialis TaxID=139415 RepID=UPI0020089E7B|nr:uncharacterized protein B0H18DRAFT_614621 [Neoantrodia serialis]KAH9920175.1 hypothetical protein B0H18DRAFT_614621 [Neoantrodia serialis]